MADITTIAASGLTLYFEIYDTNGNVWNTSSSTLVTYSPSSVTSYVIAMTEGTGSSPYYSGTMPTALPAGVYSVIISRQAGGSPASTDQTVGEGILNWTGSSATYTTNYVTTSAIKTFLNISVTTYDGLLTTLAAAASATIDSYCRRPLGFWLQSITEDYDGTDDQILQLNYAPVTSVTSIMMNYLYPNYTTLTSGQLYLDQKLGQVRVLPTVTTANKWFFEGPFTKYQVTYMAGFATIPADFQQACMMIVQRLYQQAQTGLLTTQEKILDWQGWFTLAQPFIGSDYGVSQILDRYKSWI